MSVPGPSFTDQGFVAPNEQTEILPAVQADIDSAFGGGLNPALETPQGQLASSETAAIGNANDMFCALANGVDPAYASGRMQDGIGRIYFISRNPALPTTVTATCVGASGTAIPTGAKAQAIDNNLYSCTQGGTIPITGTIDLQFECDTVGPIPCPAATLTTIYTVTPGWDSITNATDGVIGRNVETRAEFEERRRLSVAQNALGSLSAVLGAVLNVANVLDAFVTENVENTPTTIGGQTIGPNSLYVAAVGGTDADVAKAIWSRKSPGCGYTGNTTVVVQDTNLAYNPPYPSYSVMFERPASVPILFDVTLANTAQVPGNAESLIQAALISAFAGATGYPDRRTVH